MIEWSGKGIEPVRCRCGSYTWVVVPEEGRSVCYACGAEAPEPRNETAQIWASGKP